MRFEPKILVFACNWCSYAGADLAGVSRFQYPPNIKIIRIMCTGRMNESIILNAFLQGADGILICGCHIGDCHYISGNKKAEIVVEKAHSLIDCLGIERERLALEWVSASEAQRFSVLMNDFTEKIRALGRIPIQSIEEEEEEEAEEILAGASLQHCYSCTQCTSGCPIAIKRKSHNPRLQMRRLLYGMDERVYRDFEIWSCLTCGRCRERCPQGVNYVEFVKFARFHARKVHSLGVNSHDGLMQRLIELQILTKKQRRLSWISSSEVKKEGEYLYFVGCLPYFDIIFQENGVAALSIAKCTIRILNELGIEPALLEDEKCCGHDFLYSGDIRKFKALARSNLDAIKRAGAKKVIFSCPECYHMFNQVYPRYFKIDFEVISMVQFLSENLPKFNKMEKNLTLQDSCRLSRFERLYEQPRKILNAIPGVNFLEMKQNREESICCGSSTWTNCFNCSRRLQLERLNEAASTGADVLVTTCPKCQIHFRCAMQGNSFQFEIKDIISLVAESMRR